MREFIIQYPNWEKWGVIPSHGWFSELSDIPADWFSSATEVAQLALQQVGSDAVQSGENPAWTQYITGERAVTLQINYILHILQLSGDSEQRADTSECLQDFIEWVIKMDAERSTPVFGDEPQEERLWADNGGLLAEWDGTIPASIYSVQLHKTYTIIHEPIFE